MNMQQTREADLEAIVGEVYSALDTLREHLFEACEVLRGMQPELEALKPVPVSKREPVRVVTGTPGRNAVAQVAAGVSEAMREQVTGDHPPLCAIHKTPMKRMEGRKGPFWSCHRKMANGSWCTYRPIAA